MPIEWATRAGAEHGLGRAAGLGAVGLGVGPELEGDADDLGAALAFEQGGDGAVDPAGHGDQDAGVPRRSESARRRLQRRRRRSPGRGAGRRRRAARRGAWPVSGRRSRRRSRRFRRAAASRTGAPSTISADRRGRGSHRPASLGVEGDRRDPAVLDAQRDPREVAAGGAPGGAREGALGGRPAAALIAQVVLEKLLAPSPKGRAQASLTRIGAVGHPAAERADREQRFQIAPRPPRASSRSCRQVTRATRQPSASRMRSRSRSASKARVRAVDGPPVELDDQALRLPRGSRPRRIGRAARGRVQARPWQAMASRRRPRTASSNSFRVIPPTALPSSSSSAGRRAPPPRILLEEMRATRADWSDRRTSASFSARSSCVPATAPPPGREAFAKPR